MIFPTFKREILKTILTLFDYYVNKPYLFDSYSY